MSATNLEKISQTAINQGVPDWANAALVLGNGDIIWGLGIGMPTSEVGEVCFNTSQTGYQEILTDPSYAGQIITFTFPHIGNVGANDEDSETLTPAARGLVLRADITQPSNHRAINHLNTWLVKNNLPGVCGIDTRQLTRLIRDGGPPNGMVIHSPDRSFNISAMQEACAAWPGLKGMDLAAEVTCKQTYVWTETRWQLGIGHGQLKSPRYHIVAMDFGIKRNILRCLASAGCRITVVPATTEASEILSMNPDGIFLSNGPGDPAATGVYAVPTIQALIRSGKPIFGICLGHQILALALGAKTEKMHRGHRGANQPVKNLGTGKVEITSQNHGFVVKRENLPLGVLPTHVSLFDESLEGIQVENRPIFSVQYHPEASPGPQDSHYLFQKFINLIEAHKL